MRTHTINLGDFDEEYAGKTATIRYRRSWAGQQRVDGAGARATQDPASGNTTQTLVVDMLERAIAQLETSLIEWDLPFPINKRGFMHDDFDGDLGEWLIEQIEAHYESTARGKADGSTSVDDSMEPSLSNSGLES